ncbi:uncharacterized protein LOC143244259 [Tachypleus tridentatus]|uniref:uncharacterized protein LOC143244259 n=1 Tax=Tachypleus tridentatus TaxID=6853 RepID=UPI003FD50442
MEISDHVSNIQYTSCEKDDFVESCSENRTFNIPDTNYSDNIIYSEASQEPSSKEKVAVQKLTEKYDTLGRINVEETDKSISCSSFDDADFRQDLEDELNNLCSELTEVETFFVATKHLCLCASVWPICI